MGHARDTKADLRRDPGASAVIRAWRALTGGARVRDEQRRTLIGVSGGCDSSALLLALAAASDNLVVAHVVHDFRSAQEASADRDAVRDLVAGLLLPFVEACVQARPLGGNLEGVSRRLRYQAFARLAQENNCPFVATAHHADDLLETMLMRLLRGSGPEGLGAIRARRRLGSATLVRPMLKVTRADAERICAVAQHRWLEDPTNKDVSRLRADLRANVIPHLRRMSPNVAQHAATTSQLLLGAADLVHARAALLMRRTTRLPTEELAWERRSLRSQPAIVLGELLRHAAHELAGGWRMDRLSARVLNGAAEAIRDESTEPRVFEWAPITVRITAQQVIVGIAGQPPADV